MRVAMVVGCVLFASVASAQGWGREALEKMSGPKLDGSEMRVAIACNWETSGLRGVWDSPALGKRYADRTESTRFCIDFGRATFTNSDREDANLLVSAQRFESAVIFQIRRPGHAWLRAIEPSIAPGAIGFLTDTGQQWRFTLSVRAVFKPLNLIEGPRENGWGNVLQIGGRGQWMPSLTNTDLNLGPGYEAFDDGWLWGWSLITIDLAEKLGLR
jgi:hypothetical protein